MQPLPIAKPAFAIDDRRKPAMFHRRQIVSGCLASLTSVAATGAPLAPLSDIPYFRSGRFQFTIIQPTRMIPPVRLFPLNGKTIELTSLRGRPILLNFWASWCAACRTELPILDRLQDQASRLDVQIIAVSEDRASRTIVQQFLDQLKIRNLNVYLDPNGYVAFGDTENKRNAPFALYGLPITYAIAASGWIVGYMPGAADWRSAEAGRLIEFLRHT